MAQKRLSKKRKRTTEETGFGSKSFSDLDRLILNDGTFNVTKRGGGLKQLSIYYWLIRMHWAWLVTFVFAGFFILNLLFALGYYLGGPAQLTGGIGMKSSSEYFLHCFYFSTQTLTTVGFGFTSPLKGYSSILAALEAMIGLLSFAFATSVIYGRFSKAKARILFSNKMVVSPYRGISGLKFRIANPRRNELLGLKARVMFSHLQEEEGKSRRHYSPLDLEIDYIDMFPLPWTIVHPIDDESPIKGLTKANLVKKQSEFIIILKGYDQAFNQDVHQIYSYRANEILFDYDFEPMFDTGYEKSTTVQLDKISSVTQSK